MPSRKGTTPALRAGPRWGKPAECKFCGRPFRARSRANVYCPRKGCRKKRRALYMREYMKRWKADHPDYWKSERQREYLRKWREKHPDYFKDYASRTQKRKPVRDRRRSRLMQRRAPEGRSSGTGSPARGG